MPELPEVETVRRTLEPLLLGRRISRILLARRDIVSGPARSANLLLQHTITALERKGKQLAILARPEHDPHAQDEQRESRGQRESRDLRALVIHLGMTGQLLFLAPRAQPPQSDHIHATWTIAGTGPRALGTLLFRDPRRFGGLFPYPSRAALEKAWSALGPDALEPPPHDHPSLARLWRSRRAIKAALLDQSCIAGVGNIYADEALFLARVHPPRPAARLSAGERVAILNAIRDVMRLSLRSGGSTLRDYRNASGAPGDFQSRHQVYGRGGEPCRRCGQLLSSKTLAQRTTVWCPNCQPRRGSP